MNRIHLILLFQALVMITCAQDISRVPLLADGLVSYGAVVQRSPALGISDWRAMLPGSEILKQEMPSGDWGGLYGGYYGPFSPYNTTSFGTGSAYLAVSLDPRRGVSDEMHLVKRLRLGINSAGHDDAYGEWSRSLSGTYDTLVSQQTGQMIYLDSTWTDQYTAHMTRSQLALDASYILRKASPSRLTWYCGTGLLLGLTYMGRANVSHRVMRYRTRASGAASQWEQSIIASEHHRLQPALFAAIDALFGLDLTLGRTSPFWSSLHLFAESRAMLHFGSFPGAPASVGQASQHLFGVRFDLR